MKKRFKYSLVLGILFILFFALTNFAAAIPQDTKGHWAGKQVTELLSQEIISGYKDGTFKPDNNITRAEFVTLVNKAFGFSEAAETDYTDVEASEWFSEEIAKAKAAGYISGYPDGSFKPNKQIQRQEAAIVLAKVLKLNGNPVDSLNSFTDAGDIPEWSKSAVNTITAKGIISGYPDKTFRPAKAITRAEAAVLISSSNTSESNTLYDKQGTFGPASGSQVIDGNLIISASGVTVQNTKITGNLILDEAIGEGEVTLKNVVVLRNTVVKGGGSHSVVLKDCTIPSMTVAKEGVRIAASGKTSVRSIWLETGAALEESGTSDSGIGSVFVSAKVPASTQISLNGNFGEIFVEAKQVKLDAAGGTIGKLEIAKTAGGTAVNLASDAKVGTLELNTAVNVTGTGKIDTVIVNASGANIQQQPGSVQNPNNLPVTIDNSTSGSNTGGSSGNGTGGGGGNNPLNLMGAYLTTISSDGKSSTTEGEVDGSSSIPVGPTIKLLFDRGVVRDNWENNQSCVTLETESGTNIPISVFRTSTEVENEKESIFIKPLSDLTKGKTYKIIISPNLMANNDNTLGHEETVIFTVVSSGGGGGGGNDAPAAPGFVSAATSADGTTVNVTFSKTMANPSGKQGQFSVLVNDTTVPVTIASLSGDELKIKLTLATPVFGGDTVTVSYSKGNVTAKDGGILESFATRPVTNNSTIILPVVLSAATSLDGSKIILTFNKPMADPSGKHGQFSVLVNGTSDTVTGAVYDDTVIELMLTDLTEGADEITVSYTKGTIVSADGRAMESFSELPVTNSLAPPVFVSAATSPDGNYVNVTFNKTMASPSGKQDKFIIFVNDIENPVTAASLSTDKLKIKLKLTTPVVGGDIVTVAYNKGAVTDANLIELESFSAQPVQNTIPKLKLLEVSNKGDISITFDQNMSIPDASVMDEACSQFTVIVGGVNTLVDSIELTNTTGKIKLVISQTITTGQVVTIAYTKSANTDAQIKSANGGVLGNFATTPVTNE